MRGLGVALLTVAACSSFGSTPSDGGVQPPASDEGSDGAAPCTCDGSGLVVGTASLDGRVEDTIRTPAIDTHVFSADRTASARCACLFIAQAAPTTVQFGVYADRGSNAPDPGTLVTSTKLDVRGSGWVGAPLEQPVAVTAGERLWLAAEPQAGTILVETVSGCTVPSHTADIDPGAPLPPIFVTSHTFDECNLSAYLSE